MPSVRTHPSAIGRRHQKRSCRQRLVCPTLRFGQPKRWLHGRGAGQRHRLIRIRIISVFNEATFSARAPSRPAGIRRAPIRSWPAASTSRPARGCAGRAHRKARGGLSAPALFGVLAGSGPWEFAAVCDGRCQSRHDYLHLAERSQFAMRSGHPRAEGIGRTHRRAPRRNARAHPATCGKSMLPRVGR